MKRDLIAGIFITGMLSVVVALLGNVVASLYHPSTTTEIFLVIALFALFTSALFITTIYFQGERRSSNRFVAMLQQYGSLWLLALFVALVSLLGEIVLWAGISTIGALLIIVIAVFGYIRDLRNRKSSIQSRLSVASPKHPSAVDELPSPYAFEKPQDKKP